MTRSLSRRVAALEVAQEPDSARVEVDERAVLAEVVDHLNRWEGRSVDLERVWGLYRQDGPAGLEGEPDELAARFDQLLWARRMGYGFTAGDYGL